MHLVLGGFEGYARYYRGGLDSLGRTAFAVSGGEAVVKNMVQRVLYTGEAFGRVVVLSCMCR